MRGHALHLGSGGDGDGGGVGVRGQAGGGLEREGEVGFGGDTGGGLVTDEAGKFGERAKMNGGAEVALVGESLLVEGQDVEDDGAGVEQGDAEVICVARLEVARARGSRRWKDAPAWTRGRWSRCRRGR